MRASAAPDQKLLSSFGDIPLAFEPNRGQAPFGVSYLSRTHSGVVYLRPGSIALESTGGAISMHFAGASASSPMAKERLPGISSYFVGEERDWIHGVPNYAKVRYTSVYPGIDVVFHGNQNQLEYDFLLSPGADPGRIRIAFEGIRHIFVDEDGNLELTAAHGIMKQRKPRLWQDGPHGRREIAGRYILSGTAEARFQVDPYDRNEALVIDPVIEYSTYFGSNRDDRAQGIANDAAGATYLTGSTATGGVSWGFVSKVNTAGTAVLYNVFFGSDVCDAAGRGIAVDAGNNAVVTGYYTQLDQAGYCSVKQVLGAKINPAGDAFVYELVWGGGHDYGNAVAVDPAGNAYFTGSTKGNFPTTTGVIFPSGGAGGDAFITKFGPTGTPLYSTYLGGGSADEGLAITADGNGNAWIAGSTSSANFRTTAAAVQPVSPNTTLTGFITEVNASATQILYSTFLGGNSSEVVAGIARDAQGRIHVTGTTTSPTFPTTANAWDRTCGTDGACNPYNDGAVHKTEDVFYSKIDPLKAGMAGLIYSTFLGGTGHDFGEAIATDKNGRAWITGRVSSATGFPLVQPTQGTSGGNYDAFVAEIDSAQSGAASLLFSTFIGGALYDEGSAVNADPLGNIYVAGYTASANFPVTAALQSQTAGGNEGFVVKIAAPASVASLGIAPVAVTAGSPATGTVTLTSVAGPGGLSVALTSNNASASVPATVLVPAGQTHATFTISTSTVGAPVTAIITASYSGTAKTATLTINPPAAITALALNPASVTGGTGSTGTVTLGVAALAAGAVVALASNNTNAATVPAAVIVPAGAKTVTFAITSKPVTVPSTVTITATYNGTARPVTLTVNPAAALAAIALNPAIVAGGTGSTATVTLTAAAPAAGAVVALASNNTNAATVPPSVTVPAGAKTAIFAIASKPVTTAATVTITATYNAVAKPATLTVNPSANLAGIVLNPAAVSGGALSTGTVTLTAAAPAGGAKVVLAGNNINAATVPVSVTVAAGATAVTFTITTKPVIAATVVTITASYNGAKTTTLTVNAPASLASVTMNPAVVVFGSTATGTVALTAPAPAGGAVVALATSNWTEFALPASVTVPAGATSAKFIVNTVLFSSTTNISATYNGVTKAAALTSVPPTVVALTCTPNPVIAGTMTICTVTLNGIMPSATPVWILSDQPFFAPAAGTVTVPAGANSTRFSITTTLVPDQIVAHISASALATATVTTPLTINLTNRGRKWVLNNVAFKDGGTASGYFTYDAATGKYLDVNIRVTPGPDPNNPLGHPPGNLYYYPWPNGWYPTIVDDWSTASVLSVQNPAGDRPPAWTLFQLNFAQALTNAGGTVPLVTNPNVAYMPYCIDNIPVLCTPPPGNISQELFAMPPSAYATSGFYFRVVVSGTITAQ